MTRKILLLFGLGPVVFVLGCEEEKAGPAVSGPPVASAPAVDRKAMIAGGVASAAPVSSGPTTVDAQEFEFGESERSRDPFRSYEATFVEESRSTARSQRQVVLPDHAIEELKLIGIVTGVSDAKAMLVDPQSKGHVVRRGQFIGRAEIVHGDGRGAPAYEINWRVDRVRDGDIVLVREDPKNPEVPSATRIIPLHSDPNARVQTLDMR